MREILIRTNRGLRGPGGFLAWAAGLALVLLATARPGSAPVVEDELYWVGSAYYFHLACGEHDVAHADWRLLPARENPPVAKYVIGAALALAGERVATPDLLGEFYLLFAGVRGAWGEPADQAKRAAVVSRLGPETLQSLRESGRVDIPGAWLRPARLAMVACLAGASLGLFLLGRALVPVPWALAAALALPLHPIAAEAMNHALADAPALFFSAAAAVALAACLHRLQDGGSRRTTMALAVAAGLLSGLACAAKMNVLVVPLLAVVGFAAAPFLPGRPDGRGRPGFAGTFGAALGFGGAALAAFIIVNPALYGDVWAGLRATVDEHRRTGEIQAAFLSGRLDTWWDRCGATGLLIGFRPWAWMPLLAAALIMVHSGTPRQRFLAGWWLLAWAAVGLWIPFLRLRYAAPMLLPSLLLLVVAVDVLARRLRAAVWAST